VPLSSQSDMLWRGCSAAAASIPGRRTPEFDHCVGANACSSLSFVMKRASFCASIDEGGARRGETIAETAQGTLCWLCGGPHGTCSNCSIRHQPDEELIDLATVPDCTAARRHLLCRTRFSRLGEHDSVGDKNFAAFAIRWGEAMEVENSSANVFSTTVMCSARQRCFLA
jgi:hypothetical protein